LGPGVNVTITVFGDLAIFWRFSAKKVAMVYGNFVIFFTYVEKNANDLGTLNYYCLVVMHQIAILQ
jgi:hypothetical protein